ncbi:MAG: hypothetical protein J5785_04800 [Spirochaetales bacterium]|nr:hypothetical protein [Spirochaetales bacterium]
MKRAFLVLVILIVSCACAFCADEQTVRDGALRAVGKVLSGLGKDGETGLSVQVVTGDDGVSEVLVTLTVDERQVALRAMGIFDDRMTAEQIADVLILQFESDIAAFVTATDPDDRLDYVYRGELVSRSLSSEVPDGTFFTLDNGGVLVKRGDNGDLALFDRVYAPSLTTGMKLSRSPSPVSLGLVVGTSSAGVRLGFSPSFSYPLSPEIRVSYTYGLGLNILAGLRYSLSLYRLTGAAFTMLADARICAEADAGIGLDSKGKALWCAQYGFAYEHSLSAGWSWSVFYVRRIETSAAGTYRQNDFGAGVTRTL